MKPPNSAAPRVSTHGHLLGFDVSGFTREVQALGAAGGVHGFEMATDRLGNAFGAVVRAGCAAGYLLGDVLGDCLILTKAIGSAKDNADSAASTYAPLFAQESGFAVKAAGCHGAFRTITLPFDLPGGRTVLLGTAVAELHARLEAAEATAPVARSPGAAQRDPALLDRKLGTAVAMRSLAAFCRLGGSVADFPSDENLVHAAALLRHFCLQHGGALQKITHDSKGVVACMTLPVRFGALVDLAAAFEVVHRRLGAVGI
ncbi:MAG: hypothetical protein Q8Q62_09995, partial [Mesorhizobium sp.]|nr:hypothetical protein [Mesorhizobium sp.]